MEFWAELYHQRIQLNVRGRILFGLEFEVWISCQTYAIGVAASTMMTKILNSDWTAKVHSYQIRGSLARACELLAPPIEYTLF